MVGVKIIKAQAAYYPAIKCRRARASPAGTGRPEQSPDTNEYNANNNGAPFLMEYMEIARPSRRPAALFSLAAILNFVAKLLLNFVIRNKTFQFAQL